MTDGPLIVQSDKTLLLEVDVHTYRLTALGLWNASAAGHDAEQVVDALVRFSRYAVPTALLVDVADLMGRYGRLVLEADAEHGLVLRAATPSDQPVLEEVLRAKQVVPLVGERLGPVAVVALAWERGRLKQALVKLGWPADDRAGYVEGDAHPITLLTDDRFVLRPYQAQAVDGLFAGGSGVVVLPCGAGKTIVGAAAMARAGSKALVLVTNTVAARQWRRELLQRTSLTDAEIGEYSGERKEVRPVTIATYQVMISKKKGAFVHLDLFSAQDWGLIVYDEVHLLPAPVFRMTAEIQSRRRLGLTATLVREDGREADVFSLIGPKRYDAPWRDLESMGWIAPAVCTEVRVTLTGDERMAYAVSEPDESYRVGSTAASKHRVVEALVRRHRGEPTLVIGQFIDQLEALARRLSAPLITGRTPNRDRESLYEAFRSGAVPVLVVSKVANFSIDLPEASVGIQVSGSYGSRQEEAQRLGRILRPKADGRQASFYAVVSRDTNDQVFAAKRQRFLAEQGYAYEIVDAEAVLSA
ncbi:MAG: DEAD/DEAH box helicase [Actinobacteria bacterium]|nr:DEAD/DEAH box helicase [Actinomycetota bacterium]